MKPIQLLVPLALGALGLSGCRSATTVELPETSPALLSGVWEAPMTQVNVPNSPTRVLRLNTLLTKVGEREFTVTGTATYDGTDWQVGGSLSVGKDVTIRAQYTPAPGPDFNLLAKLTLTAADRAPLPINLASRLDGQGRLDSGFGRAYFVTLYDPTLRDMLGNLRRP